MMRNYENVELMRSRKRQKFIQRSDGTQKSRVGNMKEEEGQKLIRQQKVLKYVYRSIEALNFKQQIKIILITYLIQKQYWKRSEKNPETVKKRGKNISILAHTQQQNRFGCFAFEIIHFLHITQQFEIKNISVQTIPRLNFFKSGFFHHLIILIPDKYTYMNYQSNNFQGYTGSVFIEVDQSYSTSAMKKLLFNGRAADIRKYFLPTCEGRQMDIQKLVSSQINKHQQVLSYKNKNKLKTLLKSNKEGDLDPQELKILHESGTSSPVEEDLHQYLAINDQIDFDDYIYGR